MTNNHIFTNVDHTIYANFTSDQETWYKFVHHNYSLIIKTKCISKQNDTIITKICCSYRVLVF